MTVSGACGTLTGMRARAAAVVWMVAACGVNPAFDEAVSVAATVVEPTTEVAPPGTSTTSGAAPTSGTTEAGSAAAGGSTGATMAVVSTSSSDDWTSSDPGTTGTMDTGGTSTDDATTAAPVPGECPEDDALIACYRFEEGPGDGPMLDDSGNGRDGTRGGAGSVPSVAGYGAAIELSSFSDVHVTDSAAFAPSALTVATFVYLQPGQMNRGLIDRAGSYRLYVANNSVQCRLQLSGIDMIEFGIPLAAERWYHVACTYSGGKLRMYVHAVGAEPTTLGADAAGELLSPMGSEFILGRVAGDDSTRLTGWMDQVMLFGRALEYQEVCALAGPLC